MTAGSRAEKISTSVGLIAAIVLAVLVNVFVARHYRRWDVTKGGLYTLSEPTVTTLRSLEEPIKLYVLLSAGDPLTISVRHLLEAYRAETTRLDVEFTDPDRHPAEFLALQQRYRIVAGKTEDGTIVTDASIIVVRGDKPFFLTQHDLVEVDDAEDMRARPKLEQAITGAIRSLLLSEPPVICFTTGFGEKSTDVGGSYGLAALRDRLVKNNFEVTDLPPLHPKPGAAAGDPDGDADKPPAPEAPQKDHIGTCSVVIVAGPSDKVAGEDVARLKGYIESGGSAFLAVGPVPDEDNPRYLDLGLSDVIALAGVKLEQDFIFERDPGLRSTLGHGETFMPALRPHAITEGLIRAESRGLSIVMNVASSLSPTGKGSAGPVPLLATSDQAFGMIDFFGWAKNPTEPAPAEADHRGPLTVAYAAELPKAAKSNKDRGARIVVVSSSSVLFGANWQSDELHGTARFVESAISWLAARPMMLELPKKPSFAAGLRLSPESQSDIFRYVVLFMPLATVLLGMAVFLRRRSTERRGASESGRSS